jgi:hypothetical protein
MFTHPEIMKSLAREKQRDAIAAADRHRLLVSARRSERDATQARAHGIRPLRWLRRGGHSTPVSAPAGCSH